MQLHQDFRHAALTAGPDALWDLTCDYLARFGFDGTFMAEQRGTAMRVHSNIDADWVRYADDEGVAHTDPFFKHCFHSHEMLRTGADHLYLYPDLTADEVAFIRAASEAGLLAGVSIPVRLPTEGGLAGWHILSSHGKEAVRAAWPGDLDQLRLSVLAVHHRLAGQMRPPVALSTRERDCLMWCAEGARNAAIADRLGISDSTVEFHLRNARRKLNARTREHAVALAIRQELL